MSIFEYDEEAHIASEKEISREEGVARGIEIGVIRGIEIGRTQGKIASIIELLEVFGAVPDALRTRLDSETDDERLSRLHRLAARAKDIPEFIENYDSI